MKFAQQNYAYLHNEQQSLVFNLKYTPQMQLKIVQRLQANFVIGFANTKNSNNYILGDSKIELRTKNLVHGEYVIT